MSDFVHIHNHSHYSLQDGACTVEDLIHAHISNVGIEEILEPINITAPDFEEKLELKGSTKAKASHVEYAIRQTISEKIGEDPRYYKSLQEQLESLIAEDSKRRIDEAELLKKLVNISKQEERREMMAKEKGLTISEFAFYNLLEPFKDSLLHSSDEKMCDLTKKITQIVETRKVIDWAEKEDIQKEMRRELKGLLLKIGFSENKLEPFIREIIELAKNKPR